MGEVYTGIPKEIALKLKNHFDLHGFIETGTFHADTTLWAARNFTLVRSCDNIPAHARDARDRLRDFPHATMYEGNSVDVLEKMLAGVGFPALIWLDAHTDESCPVLKELEIINLDKNSKHIVMIDDARYFLSEDHKSWPTIANILYLASQGNRYLLITEDVIILLPKGSFGI